MAQGIYFAWIGGITYPAFTLTTTADTWGGSLQTYGNVWGGEVSTSATAIEGDDTLSDIEDTESLRIGITYGVTGEGIPDDTTFVYEGGDSVTLSNVATASATGVEIIISNDDIMSAITGLLSDDGLIVGEVYGVAGSGIPNGTSGIYEGGGVVSLSEDATETAAAGQVTLTLSDGRNTLSNIANITGLVVGQTYTAFGAGLPSGELFTYAGGNSAFLVAPATETRVGSRITIRKGVTEDDGGPFDPDVHAVKDEDIFSLVISQAEGDFATLTIEVPNPKIGPLAPGRNQWCWVSYENASGDITALFHGRLVGIAREIAKEVVVFEFVARPTDYFLQKRTLAETLKEPPYFDNAWLQEKIDDPNTALEARAELWDIDRVDLTVTTADILNGSAGTIEITVAEGFYSSLDISYSQSPLRNVNVKAVATWPQEASGEVELTDKIVSEFQAQGSPFGWPLIASFTSEGLFNSWPKNGDDIGGGWSISNSLAVDATAWMEGKIYSISYIDKSEEDEDGETNTTLFQRPATPLGGLFFNNWKTWDVTFPVNPLWISLSASYRASRSRTETLLFTVSADVQSLMVDPGSDEDETIELSSEFVGKPVDGGGELPIGFAGANCYFPTDRGQTSIQYLILLAVAKLKARSRAVLIKFACHFDDVAEIISCRHNVLLHDPRIPGGQAVGKVISYTLAYGQSLIAEITIGCAIGNGNVLPAAADGENVYIDGYIDGYFEEVGREIEIVAGEVKYESLDGIYVIDDDGVDFTNMVPDTVIKSLVIQNGPEDQRAAIDVAKNKGTDPDPINELNLRPTRVKLEMVPVEGGDFHTDYPITVHVLSIPKGIDLSAGAI